MVVSKKNRPFCSEPSLLFTGKLSEDASGAGNPYGGQVSGDISLGYKIEKGQIVGRIKDAMFSVNVFTDLRDNLVALSSDNLARQHLLPLLAAGQRQH